MTRGICCSPTEHKSHKGKHFFLLFFLPLSNVFVVADLLFGGRRLIVSRPTWLYAATGWISESQVLPLGVFQCHCESDSAVIVQHVFFFFSSLIHHILRDPGSDKVTTHPYTKNCFPFVVT